MIDTKGDGVTRRWSLQVTGVLLGCLLAGGLLVGCSAEQEASGSLPSSSAAPTTEQELPPLGPEDLPMPDEARTQDAAGAEAFVRYYIELINRTSDVMDAAPLREFSDGCEECERLASNTENALAAGHDYEDGTIAVVEMGRPLLDGATAQLAMRLDQAAFRVVDGNGTPVAGGSEAYTDISGGVALRWDVARSTWLMTQLTFS